MKYIKTVYAEIQNKTSYMTKCNVNEKSVYRMYDRYDNHCRYLGIVSKLTKKPLNRRTGIAVTGPTNTATYRAKHHCIGQQWQMKKL